MIMRSSRVHRVGDEKYDGGKSAKMIYAAVAIAAGEIARVSRRPATVSSSDESLRCKVVRRPSLGRTVFLLSQVLRILPRIRYLCPSFI